MLTFWHSLPLSLDCAVEFESTQAETVGPVGVLAELDDTEEAVAVCVELRVDHCVDLEGKRAASLTKIFVLVV